MSRGLEVVVKIAAGIVGGGFLLLLVAATVRGCRRETGRWKEEGVAKAKRVSVTLGQPLEIEYRLVPESREFAAGVEINRVYAYSGAVRVDVTPLLRDQVPSLMDDLTNRCRQAEGQLAGIPF